MAQCIFGHVGWISRDFGDSNCALPDLHARSIVFSQNLDPLRTLARVGFGELCPFHERRKAWSGWRVKRAANTRSHNESTPVARCSNRPRAFGGLRLHDIARRKISARMPVATEYQVKARGQPRRWKVKPHAIAAKIPDEKPRVANRWCSSWFEECPPHPGSQANTPAPIRPRPSRPTSPAANVE